ncbi:MAG: class I SAM-dependent rRNA methyltransferase [Pirellulaceae bacterium]
MSDSECDPSLDPPVDSSADAPVEATDDDSSGQPISEPSDLTERPGVDMAPGFASAVLQTRARKARPFYGRHPWVLDSALVPPGQPIEDGSIVDLHNDKGKFIARGIYNSRSRIRVRLYTWDVGEPLDDRFWRSRLESAARLRKTLGYDDRSAAARVVYSEADGLSGLIVDRYGDYLVAQVNSLAIAHRQATLVPMLAEVFRPRGILVRSEAGVAKSEGLEVEDGLAWGEAPDGPVFINENGLRFGVDLSAGQKTGYYLDQVENRRAAAAYMKGRRVLDLFCYAGGFSLLAATAGGAREVIGVDSSERALAMARANAELNGVSNVRFVEGDCFRTMDELLDDREKFDAIVLDPPKFTRSRQTVDEALRAYHRLNRVAVDLLQPEGILVTCSCSGNVTRDDFLMMLSGVAQKTGRMIQVLDQRGASADHPIATNCLETEYLKCFICRVV